MGAVTPIGVGVRAFAASLRAGVSGVHGYEPGDARVRTRVAATVGSAGANRGGEFDPGSVMDAADLRRVPRLVPMGLAAAREAMQMARWPDGERPVEAEEESARTRSRRIGLVLGTGGGGIDFTLDQFQTAQRGKTPSLWTITNATHGNLAGELSIRLGLRGPSYCVSTGCASSSDAAGMGLMMLRAAPPGGGPPPSLDAVVVIGADAHVRWETLYTMELLGVISTRDWASAGEDPATASRPFDRTRDGFVLGEGAWAVVLEKEESARQREVEPIGRLLGYAATCDAYHRVRPAPDMEESARAMRLAVEDAGLKADDIDLVHYHGTSTKVNDALETGAVKLAFGERAARLAGHSVKSMIGHPQGACGLAAMVATLAGLTDQDDGSGPFVHPTINLREPDPECDLDYTAQRPRAATGRERALINCLAFGAKNSALVVEAGPVR